MSKNKDHHHKLKTKTLEHNPLADIAGKFGGKFWRETQSAIERSRILDREETQQFLNSSSNQES